MFNRMPSLEDWDDPSLLRVATERLRFPKGEWPVHRKYWEWVMVVRALEEYGYLSPACTALGLGSGKERLLFALANELRLTVASDLYGLTAFAGNEADERFLHEPSAFAEFEYDERGLLVANMDACEIAFGDASFDVLFSCSSLEHFGRSDRILQAQAEAYRVLRPGGVYVLAVDYLFRLSDPFTGRSRDDRAPISDFFSAQEVRELVIAGAPFRLEEGLHLEDTYGQLFNVMDMESWQPESGEVYPHFFCGYRGNYLTSLFLVLFK